MRITAATTCKELADYIHRKYGDVNNTALVNIWILLTECNQYTLGDCTSLLKNFKEWEAAWKTETPVLWIDGCGNLRRDPEPIPAGWENVGMN